MFVPCVLLQYLVLFDADLNLTETMLINLWHAAVLQVRNLLEQTDSALKNERLEAFTSLLGTLREVVTAQCFKPDVILVSERLYCVFLYRLIICVCCCCQFFTVQSRPTADVRLRHGVRAVHIGMQKSHRGLVRLLFAVKKKIQCNETGQHVYELRIVFKAFHSCQCCGW
jgi:hypothetical protein